MNEEQPSKEAVEAAIACASINHKVDLMADDVEIILAARMQGDCIGKSFGYALTAARILAAEVEQLRAEVDRLRTALAGDVNLAPFVLTTVATGGTTLKFRKPLVLNPVLDESQQLIVLEYSDLGIHVFARTRSELYDELVKQIGMLWDEYVREDQAALDAKAIELRSKLTELIEEVTHE